MSGECYLESLCSEDLRLQTGSGISGASQSLKLSGKMARVTGLEPAASGVTGRRSNQLSYTRVVGPRNYDAGMVLSRAKLHFFRAVRFFSEGERLTVLRQRHIIKV